MRREDNGEEKVLDGARMREGGGDENVARGSRLVASVRRVFADVVGYGATNQE